MLKLRALEGYGGQLRLGCLENRLRLRHVEIGNCSPGPQVAGQLEGFGEDLDTGVEDRPLSIQRSQGEIVHGHFGLDHQVNGLEIVGAGLGLGAGGFDAAADPTPEINFVAEAQRDQKSLNVALVPKGFPVIVDGVFGEVR